MLLSRRSFSRNAVALAFSGLQLAACGAGARSGNAVGYGEMIADPKGLLDLPTGFSYRTLIRAGEAMSDGRPSPTHADGMGCFDLGGERVALVRNHELSAGDAARSAWFGQFPDSSKFYDRLATGEPFPGGTSTLICNLKTGAMEQSFLSLAGTARNCAGGVTPWGSWLSCEEDTTRAGSVAARDHGWVFEVPARQRGLADAMPIRGLGRFNHEAVAIHPSTGIAYLTEDRNEGLFYRFLPNDRRNLHAGGRLQALRLRGDAVKSDARNWDREDFEPRETKLVEWLDLDGIDSPLDDLRMRGHYAGATVFARGEGIAMGERQLYFACTSGGKKRAGQIMRYFPSQFEGQVGERDEPARLENFIESVVTSEINYCDNLTVAPGGHIFLCEDAPDNGAPDGNHLRGISLDGVIYPVARLQIPTELAGVCFSRDGATMFLNVYHPGQTLAITGPWLHLR